MLYTDIKYANLLRPKLLRFKQKSETTWNFRCPFCGDSEKSESKARGNLYNKKGSLLFRCFNCQRSTNIGGLIKHVDPYLYREYIMDNYKDGSMSTAIEQPEFLFKKEPELKDNYLKDLTCIVDLPDNHQAKKYLIGRKIPQEYLSKIYYTNTFRKWVNSHIPDKFGNKFEESRIIFPYFTKDGKVFAVNARTLDDNVDPKYIIIKFDEDRETVYGLDTVNSNEFVYVVEGQIDSMFLPNCIAVSGANFINDVTKKLKHNSVHIFDNESRSKEICSLIEKSINGGYAVCLLPDTFVFNDINDAIKNGISVDSIVKIINKYTYQGLEATLMFTKWRKRNV